MDVAQTPIHQVSSSGGVGNNGITISLIKAHDTEQDAQRVERDCQR